MGSLRYFILFASFGLVVHGQTPTPAVVMTVTTNDTQPIKTGNSFQFLITINLDKIATYTNLSVAVQSPIDTPTHAMTRLCSVATNVIGGAGLGTGPVGVAFKISADGTDMWTWWYFGLGDIVSPAGTTTVTTQFLVVHIDSPPSNGSYPMIYYAEGLSGSAVYVAYYPINFAGPDIVPYVPDPSSSVTINGPTTMKLNETQVFTASIAMDKIFPNVTMSASWTHPTLSSGLTISSIRLASWGWYWVCVEEPAYLFYPSSSTPNQASVGNQMFTVNLGKMCNIGARNNPINNTQLLIFEFTVHVYGYDLSIQGNSYSLNATFIADGNVEGTGQYSVSINGAQTSLAVPSVNMSINPVTSLTPQIGDILSVMVYVTLPFGTITDYQIRLIPDAALTALQISTCFVQTLFQGFNIPYILESPQLSQIQYSYNNPLNLVRLSAYGAYLDLGFVANTGQVSANDTENQIWFLVTFQTLNDPNLSASQQVTTGVQMVFNQGSQNQLVSQIWTLSAPIVTTTVSHSSNISFNPGLTTTHQQQRIAFSVDVNLITNQSIAGPFFSFEALGGQYDICELRVTFASRTLPCVQYMVEIRDQLTNYASSNDALLNMNRACVSDYDLAYSRDNVFTVRAVAEAPIGLPANSYQLDLLENVDNSSHSITPTLTSVTHIDSAISFSSVNVFSSLISSIVGQISNFETIALITRLKFPPGESGPYKLFVTVTNELQICGLEVYYQGDNIPCHGVGTKHVPSIVGQTLTMDFGILSNVGAIPALSSFNIDDENALTLSIAIIAKNVAVQATSATITVTDSFSYSNVLTVQEQTTFVPTTGSGPQIYYFGPTFEYNNTNVALGTIYHYKLTVLVAESSTQNISIQLFGPLNIAGDTLRFCSAVITSVGKNLPCLSDTTEPTYQQMNGSTSNNSFILDLGYVCQAPMIKSPQISLNTFSVEFTFELLPTSTLAVGNSFQLSALVGSQFQSLTLTVAPYPPTFLNSMNIWPVMSVNTDPTPVIVGTGRYQIVPFNVSLPSNNSQLTTIQISSAIFNGTPSLHIASVQVIDRGQNVPCFPTNMPLTSYNSTVTPPTLYMDNAVLNFGWVTNTGSSYRTRAGGFPSDDIIQFEATIFVTDNIQLGTNQTCLLNILLTIGNVTSNGSVEFQVQRFPADIPVLNFALAVNSPLPIYTIGNNLSVQFSLSHLINTSSAEAWSVALTFYLPSSTVFLGYEPTNNSFLTTTSGTQYIQLVYPRFLFFDQFNVSLTFQLSSFNAFTANPVVVTTIPYQLEFYSLNRTSNSLTRTFYPISDIRFNTSVQACNQALISNVSSCQIVASSVRSENSKDFIKYGSSSYWQPLLRVGDNAWVKFLFNTTTTISGLKFASLSTSYRRPLYVEVQYSFDGLTWILSSALNLTYTNEEALVNLVNPFSCLYLRIMILSADNDANTWSTYIGLQMEIYGCPSVPFQSNSLSCFSDQTGDNWGDRQFLAFGSGSAVFCNYNPKKVVRQCFLTSDGNQWKNLAPQLAFVIGKDTTTGYIYGSTANQNATLVSWDMGATWNPISSTDLSTVASTGSFIKSLIVPYNSLNENPFSSRSLTMGTWGAGFQGLFKVSGSVWDTYPRVAWIV